MTDAPAPSPAEQAVIDRFGIFAEERVVEEVARALHKADHASHGGIAWDDSDFTEWERDVYRRLAAAAVAAYRATGGAEEAVRRVEALADREDNLGSHLVTTDEIRAALAALDPS